MRVICISDTHGLHCSIERYNSIPNGDILIHAGDFQKLGKSPELYKFNNWLGTLPHRYKIVVAGNHDKTAWLLGREETKKAFTNATYLQDEEVVIEGVKIYGSPWTPMFCDWYFMLDRGSKELCDKWDNIPLDTDILVTHGPPAYKLDVSSFGGDHIGCEHLRNCVDQIKPQYHIFGHNHSGYGGTRNDHTQFINAAICGERYIPKNKPICFFIKSR